MLRVAAEAHSVSPSFSSHLSFSPIDHAVYGLLGGKKPRVRGQDSVKTILDNWTKVIFGKGESGQRLDPSHRSQARVVSTAVYTYIPFGLILQCP